MRARLKSRWRKRELEMAELNIVEKVLALEKVELFKGLNPDQLARIASISEEKTLPEGTVMFDSTVTPDALSVVLEGSVELRSPEGVATSAVQSDVVGAWALFDTDPLRITAKTLESVRLLRIGRDEFYDLLSDNMEITASIFATLVRRFRRLVDGGSTK